MAKINPVQPLLIQLYGFPGSGKTYFARQLCDHIKAAHIQGDRIRHELFEKPRYDKEENNVVTQLMDYMAQEFLNAGISVVYDTNAQRYSQRHALREMARKAHAQPILMWLQVDADSAFQRTTQRDRRRNDDKYAAPIDRETFNSIVGHMQNPQNTEDYLVLSGKHVFKTQFSAVMKRLHELKLISSNEAATQVVKPGMVNLVPNPATAPAAGRVDMTRRNIMIR